ncbi:major facilitator transporter [Rhodococcus opacus M213]|uniref:Putative proline/betaine transporter n=1 Tax=Rhodococcus opacus M213 TaxID=1129896 RepID=K8X8V4_RHOOP|nr:MFS transporter [Rhodococcus opacus]EKT77954.1 major facilitator transporter [Rhodococcus opacus M213]
MTTSTPAPSSADMQRRARLGSFIGTTIEWYDFYLYGTAAALVFPHLFFPSYSPLTGTLLALLTYSAGFIARPLGGVIMGHFGDRIGRKAMLVSSLMIMGVATTLIGVLPTFAVAGIWAPILLLVLRIVQGFGVGGEWGGAVLVAVEHAPPSRRGLFGAWPQAGVPAGLLLANGVFMSLTLTLSDEAFMTWGWRVGFLASSVMIAIGLLIRLKMEETPDFQKAKDDGHIAKFPIVEVFRKQWKQVLLAVGIKMSQNAIFYIITVFALTYVTTVLELPRSVALIGVLAASVVSMFTILFFGRLSDEYGRRRVYLIGAVLSALFAFPFFLLMDTKSSLLIWASIVIGLVFHDLMYGPQAAFMSELFEPELRYTGASVGYQVASLLAGGLSPVLAVLLLGLADNRPWPVALYMVGLSVITIIATFFSPETHRGNRSRGNPGSADFPSAGQSDVHDAGKILTSRS